MGRDHGRSRFVRREAQRVIALPGRALATSGDYRIYLEVKGVRYPHTVDPRTGRPVGHHLASVSVIDASCARADAWATALMVAGPEQGYQLAVRERLPALLIIRAHRAAEASTDHDRPTRPPRFLELATPGFPAAVNPAPRRAPP